MCPDFSGGYLLVESVEIASLNENYTQRVDYEWRPKYCHHCMYFGHEEEDCKIKQEQLQLIRIFKRFTEEEREIEVREEIV